MNFYPSDLHRDASGRVVSDRLEVVTVYSPATSDYPGEFVARSHFLSAADEVSVDAHLLARGPTLESVRDQIRDKRPGKVRLDRAPADDAVIVETWL